jgi:hypothetical protein
MYYPKQNFITSAPKEQSASVIDSPTRKFGLEFLLNYFSRKVSIEAQAFANTSFVFSSGIGLPVR